MKGFIEKTCTRNKKLLLFQQNHLLKWGYQKYFVTTTKCLVLSTKLLVAAAKVLVAATKKLFIVPNFVAVTKPFFSVHLKQTGSFQLIFYGFEHQKLLTNSL